VRRTPLPTVAATASGFLPLNPSDNKKETLRFRSAPSLPRLGTNWFGELEVKFQREVIRPHIAGRSDNSAVAVWGRLWAWPDDPLLTCS
jgi:hypothetical protein